MWHIMRITGNGKFIFFPLRNQRSDGQHFVATALCCIIVKSGEI